jgi:hypothetical protein
MPEGDVSPSGRAPLRQMGYWRGSICTEIQ